MRTTVLSTLAAIAIISSFASTASARGFWNCAYYRTAGAVQVDQSQFEDRLAELRKKCDEMKTRHEAAEVIWDNSARAYACKVGFFCNNTGN